MKKFFVCFLLLLCIGCSNAIKVDEPVAFTTYSSNRGNLGNTEFLGVRNNQSISNAFGYSYFVENLAYALEKQGIMLDRSGFLADEINLTNLKEYSTDSRYLVFGEVKKYSLFQTENKGDVSAAEHVLYGLYTLGIGNLIAETYSNTNRLTYFDFKLEINFYIFDKKVNKIIKKIPVSVEDISAVKGSWKDTDEETRKIVVSNYLINVFNKVGEELSKKL
ncbi:hypothetical protein [Fusobacterium varium]